LSDVENPRVPVHQNQDSDVYRLRRPEILTALALFVTVLGGVVYFSRDTSSDSRQEANRVLDLCTAAINASEARSRALTTDLETRTTKAIGDSEARQERQVNATANFIGKRIDTHDAQIAQLAKGKRW
jgi:hypothetical protein